MSAWLGALGLDKTLVPGVAVKVTTNGNVHEGTVVAYDDDAKVVVLETKDVNNLVMLSTNAIKLEVIAPPMSPTLMSGYAEPSIQDTMVNERMGRLVRERKQDAAKIGCNVTEEAQIVFDILSKTIPCKWDDDTIIVMECVRINKPYMPGNCSGDNAPALDRVKKMLAAERAKHSI